MNLLRKLQRRLQRSPGDKPEPEVKRAEPLLLPPRPHTSAQDGLPAIWCDDGLPTSLRSQLETLPTRIGNAATPDRPGIHIRNAGSATGADLPGSAVWWWVDAVTEVVYERLAKDHGEAVIVPDESIREQLERLIPDVVGDTWVIGEGSATPLAALFLRYYPARPDTYRLGIIGYNLKFIEPIARGLARNPGIDIRIDRWPVFAAQPTAATDEILAWSDVVVCEWCGPNAVYAAEHKKPGQRLLVRLHRFELETDHWRHVDPDQVDRFVTVGHHYQQLVLDRTGLPPEKVVVIGNHVDDLQLRRDEEAPNIPMLNRASGSLSRRS